MPDITGAAIAALGVGTVLVVYVLTWRATRESSAATKVSLRGGFAALVAALIVGGSVVSLNLRQDAAAPMALPRRVRFRQRPSPVQLHQLAEAWLTFFESSTSGGIRRR